MSLDNAEKEVIELKWEKEFLANHRWGRLKMWFPNHQDLFDEKTVSSQLTHLKKLWEQIQPINKSTKAIIQSICDLEICNWNLENSIINIYKAIGEKKSPTLLIGHLKSITSERWMNLWAYYLSLRKWLAEGAISSYDVILSYCDSKEIAMEKISTLLGKRNGLKELYVERLCLLYEFWLSGCNTLERNPQMIAQSSAVEAIEDEILNKEPKSLILEAMKFEGDGRLQPCNHKAFRRYDIIISSIGAGEWRAAIPMKGTDGIKRSTMLERYLSAIEAWSNQNREDDKKGKYKLFKKIYVLLGKQDNTKIFLTYLLVSLLRPQQIAARQLAKNRSKY
ncbi:MAG: hypothetical protein ACFFG0_21120 [Candidatus Thorarchaeota archaeon]